MSSDVPTAGSRSPTQTPTDGTRSSSPSSVSAQITAKGPGNKSSTPSGESMKRCSWPDCDCRKLCDAQMILFGD